ncbi:hypothetical protein [Occallatibacter savannae]|uniref:hypothetical protein n=1 Tax=Occallatibacter savannae TaxID=1002691 RepID=UPI001EF4EE04|nr:hypothetical protein [Occallatibacter savannae]
MRVGIPALVFGLALGITSASAQSGDLNLPRSIQAGAAFSVQAGGSGKGTLYIVGPAQFIKQDVQLGGAIEVAAGALYNAGHYSVWVTSDSSTQSGSIDVTPVQKPSDLTFIAKPSRLPVALHNAITGSAYVFDSYGNLITKPMQVSFQLTNQGSAPETRNVETRNGAAWTQMDSAAREGKAQFVARVGDVSSIRIVGEVPGDPCNIKMSARPAGNKIQLVTEPVKDCSGNAISDGTIVTFTATYGAEKTTVDVPLKKGIASVEIPAHRGATISVASGVVLGNQIRWAQ